MVYIPLNLSLTYILTHSAIDRHLSRMFMSKRNSFVVLTLLCPTPKKTRIEATARCTIMRVVTASLILDIESFLRSVRAFGTEEQMNPLARAIGFFSTVFGLFIFFPTTTNGAFNLSTFTCNHYDDVPSLLSLRFPLSPVQRNNV